MNEYEIYICTYLIGGLEHFLFSPIVGMMNKSDELIFFRGVAQPPIRYHLMLVKQCHKPSPRHHVFFFNIIGGMEIPFPVMGGKNDIVLPTLVILC